MSLRKLAITTAVTALAGCMEPFPARPPDAHEAKPSADALVGAVDAGVKVVIDATLADSGQPISDAAQEPDAAVDAEVPTQDAGAVDAALADSGQPIPDAAQEPDAAVDAEAPTPDAAQPQPPTSIISASNLSAPANEIQCYINGVVIDVRAGSVIIAPQDTGQAVAVCLIPDPGNSITVAHNREGNCQVTLTHGPVGGGGAAPQGGHLTWPGGAVTAGDNVPTTPLPPDANSRINHQGGEISPAGEVLRIDVDCR